MGADMDARVATPELLARSAGVRPLYLVESPGVTGLAVAKWRFERFGSFEERNPESILGYRAAGAMGDENGRRSRDPEASARRFGSFVPSNGRATWAVEGFEAVHVYLHPTTSSASPRIDLAGAAEIDDSSRSRIPGSRATSGC